MFRPVARALSLQRRQPCRRSAVLCSRTGVETSLDTAGASACATYASQIGPSDKYQYFRRTPLVTSL